MKKTNIAIIGCGAIANAAHIPSYLKNPDAEIRYFCDIIPERAEEAVKKAGKGKAVADYHDFLSDPELDAVSVCTPNNVHAPITIDFLKAGKHVLCEKPAARTYGEALEMQKAQRDTGKILNIGVVNRFNTAVNHIRDLIQAGDLGGIYHVAISFRSHRSIPGLGGGFTNQEIAGGGVLIDWGVHFIDLAMYCIGEPKPLTVSGQAYSRLGRDMEGYAYTSMWAGPPQYDGVYDVEDFVTGMIRTEGPTVSLNGAWAQNIGIDEKYIDFIGDKAGIRLQYGENFRLYTTRDQMLMEWKPDFPTTNMYQNEIDSFIRCVQAGERNQGDIDHALITSRIMQALYDSSSQKQEIRLG